MLCLNLCRRFLSRHIRRFATTNEVFPLSSLRVSGAVASPLTRRRLAVGCASNIALGKSKTHRDPFQLQSRDVLPRVRKTSAIAADPLHRSTHSPSGSPFRTHQLLNVFNEHLGFGANGEDPLARVKNEAPEIHLASDMGTRDTAGAFVTAAR